MGSRGGGEGDEHVDVRPVHVVRCACASPYPCHLPFPSSPLSPPSPLPWAWLAGVHELERAGIRAAFMNAVVAATDRANQLSKM